MRHARAQHEAKTKAAEHAKLEAKILQATPKRTLTAEAICDPNPAKLTAEAICDPIPAKRRRFQKKPSNQCGEGKTNNKQTGAIKAAVTKEELGVPSPTSTVTQSPATIPYSPAGAATEKPAIAQPTEKQATAQQAEKPAGAQQSQAQKQRAEWQAYVRSLEPAGKRSARTPKVPPEIALRIVSEQDKKTWFKI